MKYLFRLVLVLSVFLLNSCGLAQSALKLPGSILQTVGRTAGLVNNEGVTSEEIDSSRFD